MAEKRRKFRYPMSVPLGAHKMIVSARIRDFNVHHAKYSRSAA